MPSQFVKCPPLLSPRVTVAFLTSVRPPNPRPEMTTCCVAGPVLVTVTGQDASAPGRAVKLSWFADSRSVGPDRVVAARLPGSQEASSTALRLSSRPAPCSMAGAPRSVAVDSRICFTADGVGRVPWCCCAYAWMTSAAAPATSDAAWLVPALSARVDGLPR